METTNQKSTPFFARFLEAQEKNNPQPRVEGGKEEDMEQWITKPWLDGAQTQKYPSDGDEV